MSPRSAEQFETLRQKSRRAILRTALKLFVRKGYARTTTADIAAGAGMSKGLIYNYFTSKEQILESLVADRLRAAIPRLTAYDEDVDPRTQLEELIHQWIRLMKTDPNLLRLGLQLHTIDEFRRLADRRGRDLYEIFAAGVTKIFERLGSAAPDVDTMLFFSMFDGIGLNYTAAPKVFPIDDMEQRLVAMYCGRKERRT